MNKKFIMALAAGFMAIGLVGCNNGGNDEPQQTPEGQRTAIDTALGADIAADNGGKGLLDKTTGTHNRLEFGGSLSLLKQFSKKIKGVTYVVNIEWDYDRTVYGNPDPSASKYEYAEGSTEALAKVKKWETDNQDELKYYCSFVYDEHDHDFEFKGILTIGELREEISFMVLLAGREMKYKAMSHEEFYEVGQNAEGKPYFKNWMQEGAADYGKMVGDYTYDHGTKLTVKGKIIYVSPDQNFAYLADGDRILSLYHCELAGDKAMFYKGNYVKTNVYISSYYGAPQVANMDLSEEFDSAADLGIAEPSGRALEVSGAQLAGKFGESDRISQYSDYHYRIVSLTGKFVKSSLPSNASEKGRFTFEVLAADGNKVKVAYNYHTAFSANFITMLKGLADNADIMVTGSMTYASDNEKAPNSFNPGNGGSWTIVPLDEAVAVQTLA